VNAVVLLSAVGRPVKTELDTIRKENMRLIG
jgi:hypothetical protein